MVIIYGTGVYQVEQTRINRRIPVRRVEPISPMAETPLFLLRKQRDEYMSDLNIPMESDGHLSERGSSSLSRLDLYA